MVRHPLPGQQDLFIENPGLLAGLFHDKLVLQVGSLKQKKSVGQDNYRADGYNKLDGKIHVAMARSRLEFANYPTIISLQHEVIKFYVTKR